MKNVNLFFAFLIISFQSIAQTYLCETTHIGKMVTKPLLKNGKINYDLAVRDTNDSRAKTGLDITSIVDRTKKDGSVYVARHITRGEISYDLLFVNDKSGKCTYQITRIGKDGVYGIRLDEKGDVIDWDENTPNSEDMQKQQEKLANEWITYFE
jgi:hypothetical protein